MQFFETIRTQAEGEAKCIRHHRGHSEYAHVRLLLEPLNRGGGLEFRERVVEDGTIPDKSLGYIEAAVLEVLRAGPLHGFAVADVCITVVDGSYHEVDSTTEAFQAAAVSAFSDAAARVDWTVLEPIVAFEIAVPEEFSGHTIGEVKARRGMVKSMDPRKGKLWLSGQMPESEMLVFLSDLTKATAGRAICYVQRFSHYEERPDQPEPPDAWAAT